LLLPALGVNEAAVDPVFMDRMGCECSTAGDLRVGRTFASLFDQALLLGGRRGDVIGAPSAPGGDIPPSQGVTLSCAVLR